MKTPIKTFAVHTFLLFVLLLAPKAANATTYTLTVSTNGSGAVGLNPNLAAYPANSTVSATATPAGGWYFSGWSGDASGNANPINVQMTANKSITANFAPVPTYTLTVTTNGSGTVALSPSGGTYNSNTVVTATATPSAGWVFLDWTGDASGTTNGISLTMNSDKNITADFAEPAAILSGPSDISTNVGATVTFTVNAVGSPDPVYQWTFNNTPVGANSTSLVLTDVQLSQAGTYRILVTNAYGAASNAAVLTLTNAPSGSNQVNVPTQTALQNAIQNGGTVTFGFNGTLLFTNQIDITNDVILDASGRTVTLSGNNATRLFYVHSNINFTISNLTLAYGFNRGSNGANAGSSPAQSGFPGQGGAIFSDRGIVKLLSCTVVSNSVIGGNAGVGGPIFSTNGLGGNGCGGAIFANGGSLLLDQTSVFANVANGGPGVPQNGPIVNGTGGNGCGGAIYLTNASVGLVSSTLSTNLAYVPPGGLPFSFLASADGGAVYVDSGTLLVSNSAVLNNSATGGNVPANMNDIMCPQPAYGGGIAAYGGTVTVLYSQISSNTSSGGNAYRYSGTGQSQGGGIFCAGTLLASNSTFSGNQANSGSDSSINGNGCGGAIYNSGTATLLACTLCYNSAAGGNAIVFGSPGVPFPGGHGLGGGLFSAGSTAITNCTFALNLAHGGAGAYPNGVPGNGIGGGICVSNGTLTAVNITVASNNVVAGQGYLYFGTADGANAANLTNTNSTLALENSILAYPLAGHDAFGTITDDGYNIADDGSANFESGTSFNYTDPMLLALADNGGPTLTMALSADSPAIDFGTTSGAPQIDQRGTFRPSGTSTDMGAYEYQQSSFAVPSLIITGNTSSNLMLSFYGETGATYYLRCSTDLLSWPIVSTIGPMTNSGTVYCPPATTGQEKAFYKLSIP